MTKVLALDPFHDAGLALLRSHRSIDLVYLPEPKDDEIARHMRDTEILLLRGRCLPGEVFEAAERLRLVSRHGVGCDNLDFDRLKRRNVTVAITANANLISVAEHAFMLMLAASKNIILADSSVRAKKWGVRDHLGSRDIDGSAVLVVGYGRIGQAFAKRVAAFGGRVSFFDPLLPDTVPLPEGVVRTQDLGASVAQADIISIHIPYTDATANLFDAAMLAKCREGSILVNTSRGGIVNETALLAALDAGRPAMYATDVLIDEPPKPDNPLLDRIDVIITPHSAATTQQAMIRMSVGAAQNALDYLSGTLSSAMIALPRGGSAEPRAVESTLDTVTERAFAEDGGRKAMY